MSKDFEEKKANYSLGVTSTTQREQVADSPETEQSAKMLRDIARLLKPKGFKNDHYKGSLCVHMYYSEILGQMFFVCQLQEDAKTGEWLARIGIQELMKRMQEKYAGRILGADEERLLMGWVADSVLNPDWSGMKMSTDKKITLNLSHNQRWFIVFILEQALRKPEALLNALEATLKPGEQIDFEEMARGMIDLIQQLAELKQ